MFDASRRKSNRAGPCRPGPGRHAPALSTPGIVITQQVPIIPTVLCYLVTMPLVRGAPVSQADAHSGELERILRLQVPVIVKLAERKLQLSEVMRLGVGAIIEFIKSSDEPLELLINNKVIGVGEAVKVGENFGIRLKQIGDVKQIIASLAGGGENH